MVTTNKAKIPVGFVIAGKYRVTGELGRGGMAAVYEAENVDIGKRVAIKVLAQELISSTVVVERFLREARAVAAIRSPHICDVYDSGRLDDGRPFLVLELLEGESLYERMTRVGQIDVATTAAVITQTCKGLAKAHAANIVHRDLKPENIYITKDEEGRVLAKILDFGLAKFYAPLSSGSPHQARLTREGAVFGTPAYMSPEQVRGQGAVDARADLWALACITYESLTGKTVWATEQGVAMTFAQIANAPLPDPMALRPDLPESFRSWYARALDRNIEKRFQTPKEFAEALCRSLEVAPQLTAGAEDEGTGRVGSEGSRQTPGDGEAIRGSRALFASRRSTKSDGAALRGHSSGRTVLTILATGAVIAAGYAVYRFAWPGPSSVPTVPPPASVDAGIVASAGPKPTTTASAVNQGGLPFRALVSKAQDAIVSSDLDAAQRLLKEAYAAGGHGMPKVLLEHLEQGLDAKRKKGTCTLTGLGRPRTYDLLEEKVRRVPCGKPSIAVGSQGPVVVWTEPKEGGETWAYAVALDQAMRAKTEPFAFTTEGQTIGRPEIHAVGQQFAVSYWEARGPDAGVFLRYLDADGRVASAPSKLGQAPGGASNPTLITLKDGSFVVAWVASTDPNTDNVFLRRASATLEPIGGVVQVTALKSSMARKTRIRELVGAADTTGLHFLIRVDRDPERQLQHVRIPIADVDKGVESKKPATVDKSMGEMAIVNTDKGRVEQIDLACGTAGCFGVWGEESRAGASVAVFQETGAASLKREMFSRSGNRPSIAITETGTYRIFYQEAYPGLISHLATTEITRDKASAPVRFARVTDGQPAPSATPGRKQGEWFVAWQDNEVGQPEVYTARIECK